jgi:hypothetical protein
MVHTYKKPVSHIALVRCGKTIIATAVIYGSFEGLFHLVSGKVRLVSISQP